MSKFKVGDKVRVKQSAIVGTIVSTNNIQKTVMIQDGDEVIEVSNKLVVLWSTISWLIKFFIKLFKKRK